MKLSAKIRPAAQPPEGWRWFGAFAGLCLLVTLIRLLWAGSSDLWNGADSLFYAVLGRNLAAGRGFVVDQVRFFFEPYAQVIGRPDDWLNPLVPLAMAPFVRLLGETFLAFSAPAILSGGLGLPLVTRALALQLGGSPRLALAAGVTAVFHPMLFMAGQQPMTDIPFALLVSICVYWFLRLDEGTRAAVWAGLFLGLACLARAVGLWLFLVLPLSHALRRRRFRGAVAPEVGLLLGVAGLVMLPWLVRNQLLFGSPLYSVYQYVGPFAGRADTSLESAFGFWWHRQPPSLLDRYLHQPVGQALSFVAKYLVWGFDMTFVGLIKSANVRAEIGVDQYNYHLYQGLLGLPALAALWHRRRLWQAQCALLLTGSLILFIAVVNLPATPRYFFSSYPLVIAYGWFGWQDLLERLHLPPHWPRQAWWTILAMLTVSGAALDTIRGSRMQLPSDPAGYVKQLAQRNLILEYVDHVPPDAVVLAGVHPGALSLFGHRAAVVVPSGASPVELREVLDHYPITHAILPEELAGLLRAWGWKVNFSAPPIYGLVRPGGLPDGAR